MTTKGTSNYKPRVGAQEWLALGLAVAITLMGGALYGYYSQRWGPPADLVTAGKHLESLPQQIGNWTMVEELPFGETEREMLECSGYVNRRYINRDSGKTVSLAIIVGPPGPTAVHTPEICFSSRAYERQGERREIVLEDSPLDRHSYWTVDFSSRNPLADSLRVYYAWSLGRTWQASKSPRFEFGAAQMLYKIQLAAPIAYRSASDESDPVREFLSDLNQSGWNLDGV